MKMQFYFEKKVGYGFDEAVDRITEELKKQGFGILTEIDMHEKFREKLGKDFRKYRILGACNPALAYRAVQIEDKIGTMLPCSVIVQELSPEKSEVAAIDPYASMKGIGSSQLLELASEAGEMLKKAVDNL
jgi:uncharacterized protein (DUF302 family)